MSLPDEALASLPAWAQAELREHREETGAMPADGDAPLDELESDFSYESDYPPRDEQESRKHLIPVFQRPLQHLVEHFTTFYKVLFCCRDLCYSTLQLGQIVKSNCKVLWNTEFAGSSEECSRRGCCLPRRFPDAAAQAVPTGSTAA